MQDLESPSVAFAPWFRVTILLIIIACFTVLIALSVRAYHDAPPIPERVVGPAGELVFTGADITAGQQVFLRYGLMDNGTIWGHGAYLGPDYSAEYLHRLASEARMSLIRELDRRDTAFVGLELGDLVRLRLRDLLKTNRYDPASRTLTFTEPEANSFRHQVGWWAQHFMTPEASAGLRAQLITDPTELRQLTAFFAWTAWASVANRPGRSYSYTSNFPYDPDVGNVPSTEAILWSALSLITLLGATGVVLFAFGKFDYLGWHGESGRLRSLMTPGEATPSQRATIKYFVIVAALFLAQTLVGGATAHYRADPGSFFGLDLSTIFPSNILRTWHLQLAIFWIATAFVAGGLLLAPAVGGQEPRRQVAGVNFLFGALVIVVVGSLLGEYLGVNRLLGPVWYWFGDQGWEYLELGRAWQYLLAIGLVIWLVLLFRGLAPARRDPEHRELSSLFLVAAVAIPVFYLPALFFNGATHFSVVDMWRFWIIHLWVEGFFELFVTAMVAVIFHQLGMISHTTAARVVYLDALLYLGSGIVGTGHHWYWTGQSHITMALAAVFSAMETVPLTLLTLDAWDFVKVTRGKCETCGRDLSQTHQWTFRFLIAVGVWNFLGAGVFGFLINLPIVSYFEVGTNLTPNHGHAAMMGVFGMLAIALLVFALRHVLTDEQWKRPERFVRVGFWGLNIGLASMVVTNLFPGGVYQLSDVLRNGYWHARSAEFLGSPWMRAIEWARLPGDVVFIVAGVLPILAAAILTYVSLRRGTVDRAA